MSLAPHETVHRIGPASVSGFRPRADELALSPPGVSVLAGGTPAGAIAQMRAVYSRSRKWRTAAAVGTASVAAVRSAGFDVIADPTPNFANHVRLIHPRGAAGFTDDNLAALAAVFTESVV